MPAYANLNLTCLFPNPLGSVTPCVRWIEDYPLPDGLKMPSHIGSYDRKGDPDNFLYLFEGAMRMHKWLMPVACHMFTYTLKDSARIWWNSQKRKLMRSNIRTLLPKVEIVNQISSSGLQYSPEGIFREESWLLGEIPLEVTIREGPLTIMKTLTFVIEGSDSLHNILLGEQLCKKWGS
nr:Gag protein [Tanacetum cinerariifolium]